MKSGTWLKVVGIIFAVLLLACGIVSCAGKFRASSPPNNPKAQLQSSIQKEVPPLEASSRSPNSIGININAPLDWSEDRLYANVITMSRPFTKSSDANNTAAGPAPVDADGWPTSDFSFYVWAGIGNMHGTYTLSFKGQASVVSNLGKVSVSYDPTTNVSSGKISYKNKSNNFLTLSFTGTKRTASSALGSGVTAIKLMRPVTPGASQSYPPSALFADPIKALIAKFGVVRFMDFLATNANLQTNWSDRALPSAASFQRNPGGAYGWQGLGGPWEHVILLMNETGKDAWINLPVRATDDYIRKVALMFAYGSDGVNPYTSPQANPVYPPLNANLKVYVEYSNEVWNGGAGFTQFGDNCQAASDELVSSGGNSPLNWDGLWKGALFKNTGWDFVLCNRQTTKRSVEISNMFRSVFGDAAMGTRIRPVLMSQLGNSMAALFDQTSMLLNYYNNLGGNFVATPKAPSYYFYGAGGSAYYGPAVTVSTLDAFFADPGMTAAGFAPALQGDAGLVAAMGLKRVAYEGGPSLDKTGDVRDAVSVQAVDSARMTTALVDLHNAWSSNGGDLLVYLSSTGDYQWGFTRDVYNLTAPKLLAIDAINAAPAAPVSIGTAVPGSVAGSAPNACSRGWGCAPMNDNLDANGSPVWASYSFRSTGPATWKITLSFTSATSDSKVGVYVDGVLVGEQTTTGGSLVFNANVTSAGLHGVVVRAAAGSFLIKSVAVK